jgi:hypothetical protein
MQRVNSRLMIDVWTIDVDYEYDLSHGVGVFDSIQMILSQRRPLKGNETLFLEVNTPKTTSYELSS